MCDLCVIAVTHAQWLYKLDFMAEETPIGALGVVRRQAALRDTARAMSEENIEVVRRNIEAWNRRDLTTWLASFRSDAEIDWSRARAPFKGVYRGHGQCEAFWEEFWSTFQDVQLETHNLTHAGSEVVFENTAHLRGREGIEVIARSTFVFTVEKGQVTRLRMFQERAEALEAAGLRQ